MPPNAPVIERQDMSVERDIGQIQGALKAHEDRMDRMDGFYTKTLEAVNARFDKQDGKLDLIISRTIREDGASGVWTRILGGIAALGAAVISGHWIWPGTK